MEMSPLYLPAILFVGAIIMLAALLNRYRRCPSDKILVIFGTRGTNGSAKCIHGGGAFVWPIIQDYAYLSLTPISIEANLTNASRDKTSASTCLAASPWVFRPKATR